MTPVTLDRPAYLVCQDHLRAPIQALRPPQEATSADLPASQPEPGHLDTPQSSDPSEWGHGVAKKTLPPEIDAALTRALADAWDECVGEAHDCGWLHDPARDDMHARNPYRQEQP